MLKSLADRRGSSESAIDSADQSCAPASEARRRLTARASSLRSGVKSTGIAGLYTEVIESSGRSLQASDTFLSRDDISGVTRTVLEFAIRGSIREATTSLQSIFREAAIGGTVTVETMLPVVNQVSQSQAAGSTMLFQLTRIKSKDSATFVHSIAVSALMMQFAEQLGFDKNTTQIIGIGGLLHDIGKLFVPSDILRKEGPLTPKEMRAIRKHPGQGHAFLMRQPKLPEQVLDICRHHHEQVGGGGYPDRLSGESISVPARIAAICDVFDALTSVRPYKKPWSAADALRWMFEREGHFDRQLLVTFAACIHM